jgi:hypothetical protein
MERCGKLKNIIPSLMAATSAPVNATQVNKKNSIYQGSIVR